MNRNSAHYSFPLGAFTATVVSDGQASFPAWPLYAPNATPTQVDEALTSRFLPPNYLLQCNVLVLDTGSRRVLFDTGAGAMLGPSLGQLPGRLRAAGVDPDTITDVLLTHAHLDPVSGLVDATGAPAFPNAAVRLAEAEWDFWRQADPDLSALPLPPEFRQNFTLAAHRNLLALQERIVPFRFGAEVVPGIAALDARGHSPGHAAFLLESQGQRLLHLGDVFHHEAFDLAHPHWATAFDHDVKQAYQTRCRLLDQAVQERALVLAYHAPFPAAGHVRVLGQGYGWEATPWLVQP